MARYDLEGNVVDDPVEEEDIIDEVKKNKRKSTLFTAIVKSMNEKTGHLYDEMDPFVEKDYTPFVVNKMYSMCPSTVHFANCMNQYHFLPKKMQYDFYYYGLDRAKRWKPWAKNTEYFEGVEVIKKYLNCSSKKARQHLKLLTDDDIKFMEEELGL